MIEMNNGQVRLHQGDSRDVLKLLPDNSIDSIVCDPPYALVSIQKRFGKPGSAPAQHGTDGLYARASSGFMGKDWDVGETAFAETFWAECLRVLKPGGHVVAFGGTRTYHRLVCAIEDAGFEIRDQLGWVYGSGFPKSHDVSKGIDKAKHGERAQVLLACNWIADRCEELGIGKRELDQVAGTSDMGGWWASRLPHRSAVPTLEQWTKIEKLLGEPPEWMLPLLKPANAVGEAWQTAEVIGTGKSAIANSAEKDRHTVGASKAVEFDLKAANSDAARQWQGWGTALKPAWEPICLARKPLIGTVAENVLEHGTGAINIDGSRVPGGNEHTLGRWPANIIHDGSDEVLAAFPDSNGSGAARTLKRGKRDGEGWGMADEPGELRDAGTGSAARFFYCAKASRKDRDEGLGHRESETVGDGPTVAADNAYQRGKTERKNIHPTVKPTALMAYLCRLITPPGGTILDPFMGSGSTGKAAVLEGFNFVGIEREDEYMPIAEARIAWAVLRAQGGVVDFEPAAVAPQPQPANDNVPLDLFSGAA